MKSLRLFLILAAGALLFSCSSIPAEMTWKAGFDHPLWKGERSGADIVLLVPQDAGRLELKVKGPRFVTANWVTMVTGDVLAEGYNQCGSRVRNEWDSLRVADRISNEPFADVVAGAENHIWLSVKVPADCKPGSYSGTLTVSGKNLKTSRLPFSFDVADRTLPSPDKWKFHLDLWQNPYAVARYHNVQLWSDEHFDKMRPVFELLAEAGQKVITATILDRPWNGQTEDPFGSMVTKYKHADGSWTYDYSVFDKWVEFMMSLGIDRQINCYSMIPWRLSFDYVDAGSGEARQVTASADSPEYHDYWVPFLKDFASHLKDKGWFGKTCIAMDERPLDAMKACLAVIREAEPDFKVALAGSFHEEIQDQLYDLSVTSPEIYSVEDIAERRSMGYVSTYYTCCAEKYPNTFIASDPFEAVWLGWYAMAKDFDGYLRWAFNSWTADPVNDARFRSWAAGDCYIVYPDGCSSIRFERLIEGIQDYEKASILRQEWAAAGENAKLEAMDAALCRFTISTLGKEGPMPAINAARKLLDD